MATQKLKKSLPKRCTNERLKTRRAASYQRGQDAKARRRSAQESRERANRQTPGPTPWERAKIEARKSYVPVLEKDRKALVITKTTTNEQIWYALRRKFLGVHGITVNYLEEVHGRWNAIGGRLRGGAL